MFVICRTVVTFRVDEATDALITSLALPGETRSDTIRRALTDAARFPRRERMRAEAETLTGDPDDRAEAARVREEMDELRAR